jgi:hypothetical protein
MPHRSQRYPRHWSFYIFFPIFVAGYGLDPCQPRTFSPGKRVFKPARTLRYIYFRAFSPGGGASNSTLGDADDQANISGLSLKPALTGFPQMQDRLIGSLGYSHQKLKALIDCDCLRHGESHALRREKLSQPAN